MLNFFPYLLAFGLIAPFLLRIAVGVVFVVFGWKKLGSERAGKSAFFETLGLKPGVHFAITLGVLELAIGTLLFIGLFTQIVALLAFLISIVSYYLKGKHPDSLSNTKNFFLLLAVVSLSLLFSGAGFFAFDLPL